MRPYSYIFILLAWFAVSCITNPCSVYDLKCEYLEDPLGIDTQYPRLSWKIRSESNGQAQTACLILVASSEELLEEDNGDLWNSGRIETDQSVHMVYRGKELASRDRAFWKVRIWDRNGEPSGWSRTARWEMGLSPSEWMAEWIGSDQPAREKPAKLNPAIYFRKKVSFPNEVNKARAYISGLGYYELFINGDKVGDHVLSPNHTNYDQRQSPRDFDEPAAGHMSTRVLYETWDVTPFLRPGENIFEVCLGNGWYFQNERREDLPYSYDTPRFVVQLEAELADGTQKRFLSDSSWEYSFGPILHNGIYSGEIYDARLEANSWEKAKAVRPPTGRLKAQMSPPDRVIRTIQPVSMTMPADGIYRFDLGEMISGWASLDIDGPRGAVITMQFIEEDGPPYGQTDSYILRGVGPEAWKPRFTWHAFRYIDVSSPLPLVPGNITGVVVNTDVRPGGSFQCSNKLFNTIHDNFRRTQLGNMHGGIPSDCPHRERRGYTGDGQIAARAAIFSFNMASFYTKWMNDLRDAQHTGSGYVPNTVPYQSGGGGTAWGSAYIIIPWYMYLYYGDKSILHQHYPGMKKWISYLTHLTDGSGIIHEEKLGEWVPPDVTEIPPSLVSTAYYYHVLQLMAEIAGVLQHVEDAAHFQDLAVRTKQAFNRIYYREKEKSYSIGRQGANVFALGFGLVPEDRIMDVFRSLVRNIESNTDEHFDTGMMGTPLALEVLTRYGRVDLAFNLIVPVNSTATVILPATDPEDVTIHHRRDKNGKEVRFIESGDSLVKYQVGSGHYTFTSKNAWNLVKISRLSAPGILPADSVLFLPDTATVRIISGEENAVIRYTINGDEPDEYSVIYSEPLRISSNAIIKAGVFRDGYKPSSCKTGSLAFIDPDRNGLGYQYYEGNWERIPDFTSLESIREGSIYEIGLDQIPFKADRFGLVLQGMIEIPAAALYTFYLSSNDGSKLYIDGKLIIDNDGLHGALEKQGQVKLSAGDHALRITYFQAGGGYHLKAFISGPDSNKVSIPPSILYNKTNKP